MLLFDNIKCFTNCKTLSAEAKEYNNFIDLVNTKYKEQTHNFKTYNKFTTRKNAMIVNQQQFDKLISREINSTLEWPNLFEFDDQYSNVEDGKFKLKDKLISYLYGTSARKPYGEVHTNPNVRSLVLYFRDGSFEDYTNMGRECYGVDHYEFLAIYYFLQKYIEEGKSRLFNNIFVVSQNNKIPDYFYEIFPEIQLREEWADRFIVNTSIFANTIHFCGNQLPESFLYNIPVVCEAFRQQYKFINKIKNKIFLPFFYYTGWVENDIHHIDDLDCNKHAVTYKEISESKTLKRENTTIENIYYHLGKVIPQLEKQLISDNICE